MRNGEFGIRSEANTPPQFKLRFVFIPQPLAQTWFIRCRASHKGVAPGREGNPHSKFERFCLLPLKVNSQAKYEIVIVLFGEGTIGIGCWILGSIPDKRCIKVKPFC
jgi:hypothetical protein